MTTKRPNILMLSIDALRADRTGLHGYARNTTPRLDALAAQSLVCDEHTATTAFTQPSLPSMLTSSYPLSHGGYDRGARGRPSTVFETLSKSGYRVKLLSTFPWVNRLYGYGAGVESEQLLFAVNALVGVASQTMASTLMLHRDGEVSLDDMLETVRPLLLEMYDNLDTYCDERLARRDIDRKAFAHERLVRDGYSYTKIKQIVARHRTAMSKDLRAYLDENIKERPNERNWISLEWRFARHPQALARHIVKRLTANIIAPLAPSHARLMEYECKRYVDGHALANNVINMVTSHDGDQPFFIWTHFFDTHVPYTPGTGPHWQRTAKDHLQALGYPRDIDLGIGVKKRPENDAEWETWRALYDASIHYVDQEIGRILDALEQIGRADDTLVVITSDHGEELGEHGDVSHHFRLYEHNLRVPLMFRGPDIAPARIGGLTSHLDLAPSIAALVNVPPDPSWAGEGITSTSVGSRNHVLAEAFHGGNCVFQHRPPYIAVRTATTKYLWKEFLDPTDKYSPATPELYHYRDDPDEQNNLYRPDHPELPQLDRIIARRLAGIEEISDSRIEKAFGRIGEKAVAEIRKPAGTAKLTDTGK